MWLLPALVDWKCCSQCRAPFRDTQLPCLCFHFCFHTRRGVCRPTRASLSFYSRCRFPRNDSDTRSHFPFRLASRRSAQFVDSILPPSQYRVLFWLLRDTFRKTRDSALLLPFRHILLQLASTRARGLSKFHERFVLSFPLLLYQELSLSDP